MKVDLVSERMIGRMGYVIKVRTCKITQGFDTRLSVYATVSRRGIEIAVGSAMGPEDKGVLTEEDLRPVEEKAIAKALEQAEEIRLAFVEDDTARPSDSPERSQS